jgi:hypothetical protein
MLTRLGESGAEAFAIQKIAGHTARLLNRRERCPLDSYRFSS